MIKIKTLPEVGHIGYIVKDVDESAKQFDTFYGINTFIVYDFIPMRTWVYGEEIFDCQLKIGLSNNSHGPKIEIIQPVSGEKIPHLSFIKNKGQNIHHIAYYVDDYEYWYEYYANQIDTQIIFEAEIEDEIFGKRCSFYAECKNTAGIVEISKKQ